MNSIDYLANINNLMSEYYQTRLKLDTAVDSKPFRNPRMAELADRIATKLEDEADEFRREAARWRGEN